MSATGRKKADGTRSERDATDFYETPKWCAQAGLSSGLGKPTIVIDPCAGRGSLLDAAFELGVVDCVGFEIDPALIDQPISHAVKEDECIYHADGLAQATLKRAFEYVQMSGRPEKVLVLENPPFKLGEAFARTWDGFIRQCACAGHVAWVSHLARLGWLAHQRSAWLDTVKPDGRVLSRRPSFKADGSTDAADYCWVQWGFHPEVLPGSLRLIPHPAQAGVLSYILDDSK